MKRHGRIQVAAVLLAGMAAAAGTTTAASCLDDCGKRLRSNIEKCNVLFEHGGSSYRKNTRWHNECVSKARSEFDNCRAFC